MKRMTLLSFLLLTCIVFLGTSIPAFAATSIKYGWIALDANKKPVLAGSQYSLSGAVKPVAYITNGVTTVATNSKSVVYLDNTKVGTGQALIMGKNIVGSYSCKDAFITKFTIVKPASNTTQTSNKSSQSTTSKTNTTQAATKNSEPTAKLDRTILMLDTTRYKMADLSVQMSKNVYDKSKIKWSTSDPSVASFSDKKKTTTGYTAHIVAHHYGNCVITVTLPNKKKLTCNLKVICSSDTKATSKDVKYGGFSYSGWILPQSSTEVKKGWGTKYVEAYVNNAEKLLTKYADTKSTSKLAKTLKKDAAAKTIWAYRFNNLKIKASDKNQKITSVSGKQIDRYAHNSWTNSSCYGAGLNQFTEKKLKKKKGHLAPEGWYGNGEWLLLFTSKNQWEYILHRENGQWKVKCSKISSAAQYHGHFDDYATYQFISQWDLCMTMTYKGRYNKDWTGSIRNEFSGFNDCSHNNGTIGTGTHLIHWDTSPSNHGRPSSGGCLHLGRYDKKGKKYGKAENAMYYWFHAKAGPGTRVIMY